MPGPLRTLNGTDRISVPASARLAPVRTNKPSTPPSVQQGNFRPIACVKQQSVESRSAALRGPAS